MLIIISYMYRYIYKYACFKFWKEKKLFLLGLCTLRALSQEKNVDNPMKQTCISVILLQLYIYISAYKFTFSKDYMHYTAFPFLLVSKWHTLQSQTL